LTTDKSSACEASSLTNPWSRTKISIRNP